MKFTVYSKNGCPYCTKVEKVLQLTELQHVVYKLGTDFDREEFYSKFGEGSTFPKVTMSSDLGDEETVGGCSETVKFLKERNIV
tara:strand:- start:139 stop:390 length:252 start_codon:yes stop_codon:yes gene_type:complete